MIPKKVIIMRRGRQKKAQGLSINTIVVMAIALLAMLIIVFIFRSKASVFQRGVDATCKEMGGDCRGAGTDAKCPSTKPVTTVARGCMSAGGNGADTDKGPCCISIEG